MMVQWGYRTFRSLRVQFGATFLGFLILIGAFAIATFLVIHAQNDHAVVINLAGRQRMLTQKMTWLALTQPDSPDLVTSIQYFDQTLYALHDGGLELEPTGQSVILPPAPDPILRAQQQVLHIIREALTNIRRHALVQQIWVRVEQEDGEARFIVVVDGCGFDPVSSAADGHLGLTIMRARTERSGGKLVIDSSPGAGTRVSVRFPLK